MLKNRRRSLSASRTIDHTVNLVGRIGASLRLSARKRAKETNFTIADSGHLEVLENDKHQKKSPTVVRNEDSCSNYLRVNDCRYARVDKSDCRRRSTRSAIFVNEGASRKSSINTTSSRLMEEQQVEDEPVRKRSITDRGVIESRDKKPEIGESHFGVSKMFPPSDRGSIDPANDSTIQFMDDDEDSDGEAGEQFDYQQLALLPVVQTNGHRNQRSLSSLSSPVSVGSSGYRIGPTSCPSTPAMTRRRYLKEGAVQLTRLSASLSVHERYLFLFSDLLLVSKQKGDNSYKLKEKINLESVWISSNNCTHSFVIGWPKNSIRNYIAQFSLEANKNEWFEKLSSCIKRRLRQKSTTISLVLTIEGRHQFIRREIQNGVSATEIVNALREELNLPVLDPNLAIYQLCFETGPISAYPVQRRSHSSTLVSSSSVSAPVLASHSASKSSGPIGPQLQPLHGVENVYAVIMDYVSNRAGVSLSESQLSHLDTCPLVNCRLLLRQNNATQSSSSSRVTALNFVNQIRKVLGRTDISTPSKNHLFGCRLQGSMPPQTILTLIDHLLTYGSDVEGIFRKSPKHETFRVLRAQLDQGLVPDFHQFNIHVAASLLKDYLRSIPGQLLISGNYQLWMEIVESASKPAEQRQLCRQLLRLLPPAHSVLLKNLIRLMRRIAANEAKTLMTANSLSICLAPCLLEDTNLVDSARRVPELVVYIMKNAFDLFDGYTEDTRPYIRYPTTTADTDEDAEHHGCLHQSTDSGISGDDAGGNDCGRNSAKKMSTSMIFESTCLQKPTIDLRRRKSVSPDSALFDPPMSDCSADCSYEKVSPKNAHRRGGTAVAITKAANDKRESFRRGSKQMLAVEDIVPTQFSADEEDNDDERTPVALSREPSDVKTQFPNRYEWNFDKIDRICNSFQNSVKLADLTINADDTLRPESNNEITKTTTFFSTVDSERRSRLNDHLTNRQQRVITQKIDPPKNYGTNRLSTNYDNASSLASRKISGSSIDSTIGSERSSGASSATTTGLPRRSLLTSKTETLGLLQTPSFAMERGPMVGPAKHTLACQPPLVTKQDIVKPARTELLQKVKPSNVRQEIQTHVNVRERASRFSPSGSASKCDDSAKDSRATLFSHRMSQTAKNNGTSSGIQAKRTISNAPCGTKSNLTTTPGLQRMPSMISSTRSSSSTFQTNYRNREKPQSISEPKSVPTIMRKNGLAGRTASTSSSSTTKYRPPKRTAEEILLDKLEVNWSVPDIRKAFQHHSQIKPIDTVYAKLPASSLKSSSAR